MGRTLGDLAVIALGHQHLPAREGVAQDRLGIHVLDEGRAAGAIGDLLGAVAVQQDQPRPAPPPPPSRKQPGALGR